MSDKRTIQERLRVIGLDVCDKAADRIDALEKALKWYATGGRVSSIESAARGDIDLARASEALTEDCGAIARAALNPKEPT